MTITRKSSTQRVSKAVIYNGVVYLSGQVAEDVSDDIVGQSKSTLARVDHFLAEAGTDKSRLLSALIHIKDNQDVPVFNEIWNDWLPAGCAPARTCVQATMVRDVVLVEVTVVAAL
ncbi:MAG: enamine deaminase RidA (YjgF/YER057c/UK114 family) [Gammaproteobacteria bacterium]|jgi:enamine deaminase RidA (YjgF/YER057c/UK114 family)